MAGMRGRMYGFAIATALVVAALGAGQAQAASGPVEWNVTTSRIAGAGTAWARLEKLQNGDWLAVYTVGPGPGSRLEIARSRDDGRTWSVISTVSDGTREVDNGFLFQRADGTVLLTGRSLVEGSSYRLPVWRSGDNGVSWSQHSVIDANETDGYRDDRGLWEPFLFALPDGRLTALYADDDVSFTNQGQVLAQRVWDDGTATWGAETIAVGASSSTHRPGMPGVARKAGGYVLVYEDCPGACQVRYRTSSDGTTWSGGADIAGQRCGPYVAGLHDGRLMVTSCSNAVAYSDPRGAHWTTVVPGPWSFGFAATWPALYQTSSGEVGVVVGEGGEQKIKFGRLAAVFDEFGDGDDHGWSRYGGSFAVSGGAYRLDNGSANTTGKALTGAASSSDGHVEADVTIGSPTGNAGVMARVTNPGTGADAASGYYAYLDPGAGVVGLGRQNGGWTSLGTAPMAVAPNTRYTLRLSTVGSSIKVYVGGVPRISVSDGTFTRGRVGVRSHFADAAFDNVTQVRTDERDDFADGDAAGWTARGGSAGVASGAYDLANGGGSGKSYWSIAGTERDLTFEADVRIASGSGDAGLIFRATNLGTGSDAMSGYYAGLNDAGNAVVLGRMNGSWTGIASAPVPLVPNQWYRMRVTAVGPLIRVYVGDMSTPKLTATDATFQRGYAGVRAHFTNASFDEVLLR